MRGGGGGVVVVWWWWCVHVCVCVGGVGWFGGGNGSNSALEEALGGSAMSKTTPTGFEFCFGGSPGRERHFEIEPRRFRLLFWRKSYAGAPFRSQTKKHVDLVFEEVLSGSAISKSNQNGFEI